MSAKPLPMHWRGPPPNGKYAKRGSDCASPLAHRSGRKLSGSSNERRSRWITHVGVRRLHEHGQQVAAVRVAGDALGDDAIDDAVEASDGAARSQVSWRREPERHHAEASQPGAEVLRQHFRRLRGVVRVAGDVGVEERLADDGLRERIISAWTSTVAPTCQPAMCRSVKALMTSP